MIAAAVFVILPLCLAMAAFSDLFTMTIPNRVSLILAVSFLVLAPLSGLAIQTIGMHLAAAAIVFSACFALFALNVMGGGDAKLLSATALWFGLNQSLLFLMTDVAMIGGLITLLILMARAQSDTILAFGLPVPNSILIAKKIPYGIAIAIGGFMAFPSSPLFIAALESLK
ncbi:peptidase [Rhizobium leguminosarum bv. trifolii CB782]|uniref:Peptidase n=1 Tax=Rhizobium hidalgonense TaxID=1538159 RepID=A0A2A6KBE5_9HYPH|nr:prepilin peptidase [Rhizobium hidalgonense]AHG47674.1 peptidase [Rhizobium leguminosarum bv. trifolii CB782]EJC74719.1 Flp pilus assembly protein, protease CpaA [Rhizobium leguminosarum bv. trifolii WSM2012]MDR9774363.1 prepilin peptidase [Rhizobium hidalgonense]MDR9814898.1 prepilin peptidase [Rhizobium hidalgonense]MDR9823353.1 prepilin peptidase [Rhizobium hidalgonense]